MENVNDGFNAGFQTALMLYGDLCNTHHDCSDCPLSIARGSVPCSEFISRYPKETQELLSAYKGTPETYYTIYAKRFPLNNMDRVSFCTTLCRKAVFEGATDCIYKGNTGMCMECWNAVYGGDIESAEEDDLQGMYEVDSDSNEGFGMLGY